MELSIQVNPQERTVRLREVHALAAGDVYNPVTLSNVPGAQTASLQLKLCKDSTATQTLASCSAFNDVPGHPSVRRGVLTLATQAMKTWYESLANDATATDTNGMPSALVNAWLVIFDSVKVWVACRVPLILRAMDTNVVHGVDGVSPTVSLTRSGKVVTISVTDVNGTHVEHVNDGQDGEPGGSPTVTVDRNPQTGNTRITAVNADGSATSQDIEVEDVSSVCSGVNLKQNATARDMLTCLQTMLLRLGGTVSALLLSFTCFADPPAGMAPFGDLGMDVNVVTNAEQATDLAERLGRKQDTLPYPTNAIPAAAVSGLPEPDFTVNNAELVETIGAVSPRTSLEPATNYTDSVVGSFAATGTVHQAVTASYATDADRASLATEAQVADRLGDSETGDLRTAAQIFSALDGIPSTDGLASASDISRAVGAFAETGTVHKATEATDADYASNAGTADMAHTAENAFGLMASSPYYETRTAAAIFAELDSRTTTNDVCNIVTNETVAFSLYTMDIGTHHFELTDYAVSATGGSGYGYVSFKIDGTLFTANADERGMVHIAPVIDGHMLMADGDPPLNSRPSEWSTMILFSGDNFNTPDIGSGEFADESATRNALGLSRLSDLVTATNALHKSFAPVISNTVTKAYVENLGVERGISAETATNIAGAASAVATNALRESIAAELREKADVSRTVVSTNSIIVPEMIAGGNWTYGDSMAGWPTGDLVRDAALTASATDGSIYWSAQTDYTPEGEDDLTLYRYAVAWYNPYLGTFEAAVWSDMPVPMPRTVTEIEGWDMVRDFRSMRGLTWEQSFATLSTQEPDELAWDEFEYISMSGAASAGVPTQAVETVVYSLGLADATNSLAKSLAPTITNAVANADTTYRRTIGITNINQSVQYVNITDTAPTTLAISMPADGATKDWMVYVVSVANVTLSLPAATWWMANVSCTNDVPPATPTAFWFSQVTDGVFILGRQELTEVTVP